MPAIQDMKYLICNLPLPSRYISQNQIIHFVLEYSELAWELGVVQVTHRYSSRLPALCRKLRFQIFFHPLNLEIQNQAKNIPVALFGNPIKILDKEIESLPQTQMFLSLYLRSTTLSCKQMGIGKSKFVAETQFLLEYFVLKIFL